MTTTTETSLRLTRLIQADPAAVFEAWTDPKQLNLWSAPEPMDVEAEVDLRVGGRYRLLMKGSDGGVFAAVGEYREIDRPNRLSYTWKWEEAGNDHYDTLVTVEFHDRDGATEVVLTHELFPDAEIAGKHDEGWTSCLTRLEGVFAG
ncbi:MAG: SRPBCC domain-containing protein [Acidobacteria bacterium]|nr:SRPBCC domain-containing protein [Candidatus Sulfomarinibacter kjeldsenii]